jgi:hypothetical protein
MPIEKAVYRASKNSYFSENIDLYLTGEKIIE